MKETAPPEPKNWTQILPVVPYATGEQPTTWQLCILGLALQGPSQTTEIDANRSAVFRNGFKKKKQKHNQICLHLFALQNL